MAGMGVPERAPFDHLAMHT